MTWCRRHDGHQGEQVRATSESRVTWATGIGIQGDGMDNIGNMGDMMGEKGDMDIKGDMGDMGIEGTHTWQRN